MHFIDAYVHVWTDDTAHYPLAAAYKKEDMGPARFTPEDLFKHTKPAGVSRAVLIQISFYYPKDISSEKGNGLDRPRWFTTKDRGCRGAAANPRIENQRPRAETRRDVA
jgi:hypothetical protein